MRPAIVGPSDDLVREVALEAWALLDEFMSNDPTCKTIEDPAARVRAICQIHGMYMRPAWREMRARLGQPVVDEP